MRQKTAAWRRANQGEGNDMAKPKTTKPAARRRSVLEYAASSRPHVVDRLRGVIRHVKILGLKSRNGQTYSPTAVRNAVALYANRPVFLGHPERSRAETERSPKELFGWIESPRAETDGIYGDLHYVKSHKMAAPVAELAERHPAALGLSHNAIVTESADGSVYESINRVRSVDLVTNPATTRGIFESVRGKNMKGGSLDESMAPPAGARKPASLRDVILDRVAKIMDSEQTTAQKADAIIKVVTAFLEAQAAIDRELDSLKRGPLTGRAGSLESVNRRAAFAAADEAVMGCPVPPRQSEVRESHVAPIVGGIGRIARDARRKRVWDDAFGRVLGG